MGRQDPWESDATFRRITLRRSGSWSPGFWLDSGWRCILEVDFLGAYDVCQSIGHCYIAEN